MAPSMVLPVETPEMTPGEVDDRVLHLPGIGALYLVGMIRYPGHGSHSTQPS